MIKLRIGLTIKSKIVMGDSEIQLPVLPYSLLRFARLTGIYRAWSYIRLLLDTLSIQG